jgi:hypothetical protein
MKKIIGLVILVLIFTAGFQLAQAQTGNQQYPEITTIGCDANVKCPDVLECYNFPSLGAKCAKVNPCSYYQCPANAQCLLAESSPAQVSCSPITLTVSNPTSLDLSTSSDITPQSLGVKNQSLLPTSPLYFLKEWWRGLKLAFTVNSIKKVELEMKIASEKLIEVQDVIIKGSQNLSAITKAGENYQKAVDAIKSTAVAIKDKAEQNPQVSNLLDELSQQEQLHSQFLVNLQAQVDSTIAPVIMAARENYLVDFEAIMEKLGNTSQIQTAQQKITDFKNQTNQPNQPIPNTNNSGTSTNSNPNSNFDTIISTTTCPALTPPSPDFCPNGAVVASYDDKGCPTSPKCVLNPITTNPTSTPIIPQVTPSPSVVGGDRDAHGCIPSAGYSWCGVKNKCLRVWEEDCPVNTTPPPPASGYNYNYNYNYNYTYIPNTYVGSPPPR